MAIVTAFLFCVQGGRRAGDMGGGEVGEGIENLSATQQRLTLPKKKK